MAPKTLVSFLTISLLTGCATTAPTSSVGYSSNSGVPNPRAEQLASAASECSAFFSVIQLVSNASKDAKPLNSEKSVSASRVFAQMSVSLVGLDRSRELVKRAAEAETNRFLTGVVGQSDQYVKYINAKAASCLETAKDTKIYLDTNSADKKISAAIGV
jgi:hypothetical protein